MDYRARLGQSASALPRNNPAGFAQRTGVNVFFGAESRPAGLQAQQAEKPPILADDRGPPPPGRVHGPLYLSQAGVFEHGAARESSQRHRSRVGDLAMADVVTLHHGSQVSGRSDDQRGMDVIVIEKLTDFADGGAQWMPHRGREHRIGKGAYGLIHGPRLGNGTLLDHPRLSPRDNIPTCLTWGYALSANFKYVLNRTAVALSQGFIRRILRA
jgi:hypothetical protein